MCVCVCVRTYTNVYIDTHVGSGGWRGADEDSGVMAHALVHVCVCVRACVCTCSVQWVYKLQTKLNGDRLY